MFEKIIRIGGEFEVIKVKDSFKKGTLFMLNEKKYIVTKEYDDNNESYRHLMSEGNEEIVTLRNLQSDASQDPNFKLL